MLDVDNPHTWAEVRAMTWREVWLTHELFAARDEARALHRKAERARARQREKDGGRG